MILHNNPLSFAYSRKRKRQKTDGCWPQLHGNLTPAHADGCAAQCFEGVQRGSIIILPVHPRPQAATPVCGLVLSLTCLVGVPSCGLATGSWRTGRPAPHRQIVSVCLMLPGGFLCQGSWTPLPVRQEQGKGAKLTPNNFRPATP